MRFKTQLVWVLLLALAACHLHKTIAPSKEMQAFVNSFDGSHFTIMTNLEKFKESGNVDTDDIEIKDLKKPTITDQAEENGLDVYTIKASDMERSYIYKIYWRKGKIMKISEQPTNE